MQLIEFTLGEFSEKISPFPPTQNPNIISSRQHGSLVRENCIHRALHMLQTAILEVPNEVHLPDTACILRSSTASGLGCGSETLVSTILPEALTSAY